MAKQGMKRPDETPEKKRKKQEDSVPEIQGKAKSSAQKANSPISGTSGSSLKVFHTVPLPNESSDKPIPDYYPAIDSDLARDNLQNDIPEADLGDV